jgi:hypothetical protein
MSGVICLPSEDFDLDGTEWADADDDDDSDVVYEE